MRTTLTFAALVLATLSKLTLAQSAGEAQQDSVMIYEPLFFASVNPATARDMVARLPGFTINDGDNVRGFEGAGGNILINGSRPASKSDSASGILSRTPASRVERVELIRGGVPGIDMQGQSVVANVVLRNEVSRQQALTAQTFAFEGGPVLPGGRYEFNTTANEHQWGFTVARTVPMNDSTGWGNSVRADAAGQITAQEKVTSNFDGGGLNGRFDWAGPIGAGRLELTGGMSTFEFEEDQSYRSLLQSNAGAKRVFGFNQETENADLGLRYERALSSTLTLESRAIQNLGTAEMFNRAVTNAGQQLFETQRDTGESIARVLLRWAQSPRLTVESGSELAYNFLDTEQRFTVNGTPVVLPLATTRVEELRGELFTRLSWQQSDTLAFEAGIRLERSTIEQSGQAASERSFFYPKPRLLATWNPVSNHQFRLRFERELGQLNFSDFAASSSLTNEQVLGGNLDLRPQQRWISEAVYERHFMQDGVLTLTWRHDKLEDVIDVIPLAGGLTAIGNVGDGTLDRTALNLRLPLRFVGLENGRLSLRAQYDRTELTDPTTGIKRQISKVRPFTSEISFEHDVPQYSMTWGMNYTPYMRDTTFNPDQLQEVVLRDFFSIFVERALDPTLTIRAQLTVWNDFQISREVYSDRQTQQLSYREHQQINPRDFAQLRIRKTF